MPMIERTAAVLEPCSFQRVLPSGRKSRKLHTTFWHHGALELELAQLSQALVLASGKETALFTPNPPKTEPLVASPFLLDFLYPQKSLRSLRGLLPGVIGRYDQPRYTRKPSSRLYASSAPPTLLAAPTTHTSDGREQSNSPNRSQVTLETPLQSLSLSETDISGGSTPLAERSDAGGYHLTDPNDLRRFLSVPISSEMTDRLDQAWTMYNNLPAPSKVEFQDDMLVYLSTSTRVAEAWRILEIFSTVREKHWQDRNLAPAIRAEIALQHTSRALALFKRALTTRHISAGIGALIAHALRTSAWETLSEIWQLYVRVTKQQSLKAEELKEVVAISDLGDKLTFLAGYVGTSAGGLSNPGGFEALSSILNSLARECMEHTNPDDAARFVRWLKDPLLYEDFIRVCVDKRQKETAARAYREYRALPGVKVRIFILKMLVQHVFYPHNAAGMELALKDWYIRYGKLDRWAYSKFLAFYARRGDTTSVYRLWNEFTKEHPEAIEENSDAFTYLLNAHVARGDLAKVQQTFDEIEEIYKVEPNRACWNILLHAYVNAGRYETAVKKFRDSCTAVDPDTYTFGTMMAISASRGDLDFTLELYQMAQDRNVELSIPIVDSMVLAYCQSDRPSEAEALCLTTTQERKVQGNYSLLWNTLTHYFAERRDLTSVHRILNTMVEFGLSYTAASYNELLLGLVNCKQSHHALHLLRVAHKEGVFQPTEHHYTLVMAGFLKTREPHVALQVNSMMYNMGYRQSSERMLVVLNALRKWRDIPAHRREESTIYLAKALREFYRSLGKEKSQRQRHHAGKSVDHSPHFSTMMYLFASIGRFTTVQELVNLYRRTMGDGSSNSPLPLKLLRTLMISDFHEGRYDSVKRTWSYIFEQACERGRSASSYLPSQGHDDVALAEESTDLAQAHGQAILPSWRYSLVIPLRTMYRIYTAENDADSLIRLTNKVIAEGFEIDSKGWNHYVQCLATMKRWREAFVVCNQRLMPHWTGWAAIRAGRKVPNQLPLELRRLGSNPRYLRPISYTLVLLAREFANLEQLTPLSAEASRLARDLREECPLLVHAVRTMMRTGAKAEADILDCIESFDAARLGMVDNQLGPLEVTVDMIRLPNVEVQPLESVRAASAASSVERLSGLSVGPIEVLSDAGQETVLEAGPVRYPGFRKLWQETTAESNTTNIADDSFVGSDTVTSPNVDHSLSRTALVAVSKISAALEQRAETMPIESSGTQSVEGQSSKADQAEVEDCTGDRVLPRKESQKKSSNDKATAPKTRRGSVTHREVVYV